MTTNRYKILNKGDILQPSDEAYTWANPECTHLDWMPIEKVGYIGDVIDDGHVPVRRRLSG